MSLDRHVALKAATDGAGQVMYLAEQIHDLTRNASEAQKLAMVRQHSGL